VAPLTPTFVGNSTARPDSRTERSGTTCVVRGARPVKNSYTAWKVSTDVTVCVCDWSLKETFVAPTIARAGLPSPQIASVGTPPGGAVAVAPSRLT
jgi:hypothetical protein